ncbi:hypothetical protein FSP39_018356, partial [Pinctada imbricata]
YLCDTKWFKQWKKYVGFDQWDNYNVGEKEAHPGPIDNTPLLKEDSNDLKEHLIDQLDYMLLPKDAWDKMVSWYGLINGQEPIARKVIEQGMFVKHCKVEVYLMDVKLCENSKLEEPIVRNFSRADTIEDVEKIMRKEFSIPDDKEVRLWNKYMSNTYEHLSKRDCTLQDAGMYPGQVIVIEQKNDDGTWPRQAKNTNSTNSYGASSTSTRSGSSYDSYGSGSSYYNSSYSSWNEPGRGNAAPGLCGLANLGNTCFMNSAIQCMSSVPKLTNYLLGDRWINEVNEDNPLGMGGEIAKSYTELIKTMWSGKYSYTVPRNFKLAVGRFAPQFSGYQQQDSQELLAFLLDGLHEDLNRIKKKPYIEQKDAGDRPDREVSKESWENYQKRNDSVIVDTFHGLLKSTVHCPECDKISVTFDPFCYLSLPLPIKKERQLEVFWVPICPEKRPVQLKLTVPKMGNITDLCRVLSQHVGVDPEKMIVTDVYNHRFHKVFTTEENLSHILDRDDIFIYEIPVPPDDPDTVIVPIYMREKRWKNNYSNNYQMSTWQLFGQPLLLPLPRKNCTYDVMYNTLLERIMRYVKVPPSDEQWWLTEKDGQTVETNGQDENSESEKGSDSDSGDFDIDCKGQVNGDVSEMDTSGYNSNSTSTSTSTNGELDTKKESDTKPDTEVNGDINGDVVDSKPKKVKKEHTPPGLFKFTMVNSYGSAELDYKIKKDGKPVRLHNRSYVAVDWNSIAKDKFYNERAAEDFEQSETMKQKAQKKQVIQLDHCLDLFTKEEKLGENDLWYCPRCKKHQQATKKFDLWSLPDVLIIHLKRFSYNRYYRDKLDAMVEFPGRGLNLKKYLIDERIDGPVTYELIAVSNHYGGLGGGHYTAYGKNKDDGQWYYFDDSSVSSASEDDIVSKAAYVLVYQKQNLASHVPRPETCPAPAAAGSEAMQADNEENEMETT